MHSLLTKEHFLFLSYDFNDPQIACFISSNIEQSYKKYEESIPHKQLYIKRVIIKNIVNSFIFFNKVKKFFLFIIKLINDIVYYTIILIKKRGHLFKNNKLILIVFFRIRFEK